jgi:hypothetical protein
MTKPQIISEMFRHLARGLAAPVLNIGAIRRATKQGLPEWIFVYDARMDFKAARQYFFRIFS